MELKCPYCQLRRDSHSEHRTILKRGSFFRKSDGQHLARLWCARCGKSFSAATRSRLRNQKKRRFNLKVRKLLTGGMSQREVARVLGINRKTVVRKFRFAIATAYDELKASHIGIPKCQEVEFDDLETHEHTKLKPLSVTMMVEYRTRRVLGFRVSQMPAKGLLAKRSRAKYGPRADHRPHARDALFHEMRNVVWERATLRSDSNPHYRSAVHKHFPNCNYETVFGGRAAVAGQGELKKQKFDPIFSLNHTFAMLRAHINRLFRKTWCTTKRPDQLAGHIALYVLEHNRRLSEHTIRGQF